MAYDETDDREKGGAGAGEDPGPARHGLRGSRRTRRLLRELHQKTWELELVISGAVTLALTFIPSRVDRVYYALSAQLSGINEVVGFFAFYYVKLILYTLIASFAFHLVVRALWVGLVGLDSVYPRGIAWTRLSNGPRAKRVFRRMLPSTRELIVYADGVASVTFAAGFSIAAIFVASVLGAGVLMVVGLAVGTLLPISMPPERFAALAAIFLASMLAGPALVDRWFGRHLDAPGWRRRLGDLIEWTIGFGFRLTGFQIYGPIQLTLSSRLGPRNYALGLGVLVTLVLGFFLVNDGILASGSARFSSTPWDPPRAGAMGVDPRHYEDAPNPEARRLLIPTIQTETFGEEEPWLRIFLPHNPSIDVDALGRVCPDVEPPGRTGMTRIRRRGVAPPDSLRSGIAEALSCIERLWTVSVDGIPVSDPVFYEQSGTGLHGVAWHYDLRTLPPGRHVVEVARVDGVDDDPDAVPDEDTEVSDSRPPRVYRIPFWN